MPSMWLQAAAVPRVNSDHPCCLVCCCKPTYGCNTSIQRAVEVKHPASSLQHGTRLCRCLNEFHRTTAAALTQLSTVVEVPAWKPAGAQSCLSRPLTLFAQLGPWHLLQRHSDGRSICRW